MSLSASRRGHHTARQPAPLGPRALVCLMLRTRLAAEERRVLRLAESSDPLAFGLTYYHTCKACAAARGGGAAEGRLGVGCREPGSCLLASPPGWARRYSSRTPAQHARATRRAAGQAARTRGGARARRRSEASGGSVRQAAGVGSEHVCALGGGAPCLAAYVPVGLQWCGSSSALVVLFRRTFAARGRAALWTGRYSDGTTTSGTRGASGSAAASGPGSKGNSKRPGLSARSLGTCSDPPSRTLSVERGSNHF
jgi:hypothetical protein